MIDCFWNFSRSENSVVHVCCLFSLHNPMLSQNNCSLNHLAPHGVRASCRLCESHGSSVDSERCNADLSLDFLPGLLWVSGVLNIKQCVIDPRERLACIFIMATRSENDMPERRREERDY